MARSGSTRLHRRLIGLEAGAEHDPGAMRLEPVAVRLGMHAARAGGADIGHPRAALDQQPRDQQLGALVARQGDGAVQGGAASAASIAGRDAFCAAATFPRGEPEGVADALQPCRRTVAADRADRSRPPGRLELADRRGVERMDRRHRAAVERARRAPARPGTAPPARPRGRAAPAAADRHGIHREHLAEQRDRRPVRPPALRRRTGPASISARA